MDNETVLSVFRRLHRPVSRASGRMGREQGVKVMPAKYRQGDDLLRMLASAYKSNLCTG